MMQPTPSQRSEYLQLFLFSAGLVLASFLWQGRLGFNIADEGFLWYGAQRVMAGEVPLRDFMAYDPGRYYWSAWLMRSWNDSGIMSLRAAVASFQAFGLFLGIALIARMARRDPAYLALAALTMLVWMFPRHKLFDITLSIVLVGAMLLLADRPTRRRAFFAGALVGLVALFGRNHGVYGTIASLGIMCFLAVGNVKALTFTNHLAAWGLGVIAGYAPMLLLLAIVPGYADAMWQSIRFLFEVEGTNLALSVPWPWSVAFDAVPVAASIRGVLVGLFFIGIVMFPALVVGCTTWQRARGGQPGPLLVASAFLALPYAHFAYSRADIPHLANAIFPALICAFATLSLQPAKVKWAVSAILCGASIFVMAPNHPGWRCRIAPACVATQVGTDSLAIEPYVAADLRLFGNLSADYAPDGQPFLVAPFWPGAYAALGRKAPVCGVLCRPADVLKIDVAEGKEARGKRNPPDAGSQHAMRRRSRRGNRSTRGVA